MSLVEDFLDVLHIVLEYFGVPPDMVSSKTLFVVIGAKYHRQCRLFSLIVNPLSAIFNQGCVCAGAVSLVAGSGVGQSAVRPVSQRCAHDRDQPPTDADTTRALSGTVPLSDRVRETIHFVFTAPKSTRPLAGSMCFLLGPLITRTTGSRQRHPRI